jgi:hypothetical protein
VRHRRHAGCRVAAERAADHYTLICDAPYLVRGDLREPSSGKSHAPQPFISSAAMR